MRRLFGFTENIIVRSLLVLVVSGVAVLPGCVSSYPLKPSPSPETATVGNKVGQRFPNLIFEDDSGKRHLLWDYRGKIVFLNFWASWCPPCIREMPSLQRLYDALKTEEINFILLNAGEGYEVGELYAKAKGYTLPLYRSSRRTLWDLRLASGDTYHPGRIPNSFILDRNGIILHWSKANYFWDQWTEPIRDLIKVSSHKVSRKFSTPGDGVTIEVEMIDNTPKAVHLRIYPKHGVKLSAKYGITLNATKSEGVKWLTSMPVVHKEDYDYFKAPREFTFTFTLIAQSAEIGVKVEYAYCPDDSQCFPSERIIVIPVN